jgi:two-component system invasion response regulator UvrY
MIKILIADDHSMVRMGLKKILNEESNIEISGEAGNYREVLTSLDKKIPDILLLDISMPGYDGLEVLKEVKRLYPVIKVLMLSMHPEDRYAVRAMKAGASGYVSKESAADELVNAIRKVSTGSKYLSKTLADKMMEYIGAELEMQPHELLSDREFQVLRMIAAGKTIAQIAEGLFISPSTVATYRVRLLEKLKLETDNELVRYALTHNLVD